MQWSARVELTFMHQDPLHHRALNVSGKHVFGVIEVAEDQLVEALMKEVTVIAVGAVREIVDDVTWFHRAVVADHGLLEQLGVLPLI